MLCQPTEGAELRWVGCTQPLKRRDLANDQLFGLAEGTNDQLVVFHRRFQWVFVFSRSR